MSRKQQQKKAIKRKSSKKKNRSIAEAARTMGVTNMSKI